MNVAGKIAKNTIFNFVATGFDTAGIFFTGIVLARSFGSEQYGLYSLMMWFIYLAILAVDFGIGGMIKRFIPEAMGQGNPAAAKGFVRLALVVRGVAALPTVALIIVLSGRLAALYHIPTDGMYFVLAAIVFLPYVTFSTLSGILVAFQKYDYQAYLVMATSAPRAIVAIILALMGLGVKEVLTAYALIWAVGLFLGIFLVSRLFPIRDLLQPSLLDSAARKNALTFSLVGMGMLAVDYILWQNAEIMLLGMYRSVEEVGFYSVAYKMPVMAVTLIPFVFGGVLLPAISEQYGKGDMGKIRQIYSTASRYLMMLSFPIAALGIALARPIVIAVFGIEYSPSILLMQIVFIPLAMRGLTDAVGSTIFGIREPAFLMKVGALLVCVDVALCLWLIPKYGMIGAVFATSVPRLIALPMYVGFVSRKIGTKWPLADMAKIALASVIMGLAAYLVQTPLGTLMGLVVGISVGIIVYVIATALLRIVKTQDLAILNGVQESLPARLRKPFALAVKSIDKIMVRQQTQV